jgi:hypothetical protein
MDSYVFEWRVNNHFAPSTAAKIALATAWGCDNPPSV